MTEVIDFYSRKPLYGFLSNFHRCPLTVTSEFGTYEYPTNEHFYQAMKANKFEHHMWIRAAPHPFYAMKCGRLLRKADFRKFWDKQKLHYMKIGLTAKFEDPHLRARLLNTGDAILHEDSPTDMFWGKKGEDWLGRLLMEVREEIKNDS
jgi:N-glycosidase YbiA